MSATDIAKDIVRIANTATLSKDVIDLMEKKLAILTEEVASLARQLSDANAQIASLETENAKLKAQAHRLQPAGGLSNETADVLQFFFDQGRDLSIEHIAQKFQFQMSVAEYHFDVLFKRRFVTQTRMGIETYGGSSPAMFALTSEGRSYVMEHRA
jgi:septal ring factor EnvC (AmiA/AmiB activator)